MSSQIVIKDTIVKYYENKTRTLTENYDKITGSLKSEIIENDEYRIYVETNHLVQPKFILYLNKSNGCLYRFSKGADNKLFMYKPICDNCPHSIYEILKIIENTRHMMYMQETGRKV